MGRALFQSLANSKANMKSDYIKKGSGRAVIIECLKKETATEGEVFIARLKILSSKGKDGSTPNEPGDKVGWPQMLTKFKNTALPNVKSFVLATVGVKEADVTADEFIATFEDMINYKSGEKSEYNDRVIKDVQAARGMLIDYDTYDQQTKEQKAESKANPAMKSTNTYVKFSHVADQGDIEARRKGLDATDPIQG